MAVTLVCSIIGAVFVVTMLIRVFQPKEDVGEMPHISNAIIQTWNLMTWIETAWQLTPIIIALITNTVFMKKNYENLKTALQGRSSSQKIIIPAAIEL